jgi:hypothetical protein
MTTDFSATTATIYTFPPRGRFAMNAQREGAPSVFQQPRNVKVASGAWYHDEAIQAEQGRKI